jgi:hypothetical protein
LYAGLPLTINAAGKPETPKFFFINFSIPEQADLPIQFNDVSFN